MSNKDGPLLPPSSGTIDIEIDVESPQLNNVTLFGQKNDQKEETMDQ